MPTEQPRPPSWDEEIAPAHLRPGYTVDSRTVGLDLYRLLTFVVADRHVAALIQHPHPPSDPLVQLQALAEDEVTRLLLSTAIMLRAHDDRLHGVYGESWVQTRKSEAWECGMLCRDDGKEELLVLREACDKIIHARAMRFKYVAGKEPETSYVESILYLEGELRKRRWRAGLDLVAYVRKGAALSTQL